MPRAVPVAGLIGLVLGSWLMAACGASSGPNTSEQAFLAAVHEQAPDIGNYLSDGRVVALGQATCNDLAAGVDLSDISTRLSSSDLPSPDLGAILSAASQDLCPKDGS